MNSGLISRQDEITQKPQKMSIEEACERLGLTTTDKSVWQDQSTVRKAYFKLAQKYHPDKVHSLNIQYYFLAFSSKYCCQNILKTYHLESRRP